MVGGIKASSPGMKSMSADMFLDLLTMSAPSGDWRGARTVSWGVAAAPHRSSPLGYGLCLRRFSGAQPGVRCVRR